MSKLTTNTDTAIPERNEFEILGTHEGSPHQIEIDGRVMRAGRSGAFRVHDAGLAREIDARFGHEPGAPKDLLVVPVAKRQERGHQRTFLVRLPENYKRRGEP